MLVSMILNNHDNSINNEWKLSTDAYNNTFIANESIRQRIRLGKNVKKTLEKVCEAEHVAAYKLPESTFLSNNNKNMNLSLMNFWSQDHEVKANHLDDNILYITFMNKDYKMIEYSTGYEVLQTYRKKGEYQGLAIVFKTAEGRIFTMKAQDLRDKTFVEITVDVDSEGNMTANYTTIEDKHEIGNLVNKLKKFGPRVPHFVMDVDKLPTNTFIIDDGYADAVKDLLNDIPNAQVISLIGGSEAFSEDRTDEEKKSVDELMKKHIVDERVRAITTIGVRLPKTFCRTYNILYLFNYDMETNRITCVRSNQFSLVIIYYLDES